MTLHLLDNVRVARAVRPPFSLARSHWLNSLAASSLAASSSARNSSAINGGLQPHQLALIIHYIHEHLDEALSLEAIAKVVCISPSYLLVLFKQSTGLAPHQYVMVQRVERAKLLLTQTRLPIKEIASQSGFSDQSHLTRLVRRYTGLTPKQLRGS